MPSRFIRFAALALLFTGCGKSTPTSQAISPSAWCGEWFLDGEDTRVRIDKVKVMKPKMKGHEFEWIHERLQVTLRIENTALRKQGVWTPPLASDVFLNDRHDNVILSKTDEVPQGWEGTLEGPQLLEPNSHIFHVLYFDKPTSDSGHMNLTINRDRRDSKRLTIPPYAWTMTVSK